MAQCVCVGGGGGGGGGLRVEWTLPHTVHPETFAIRYPMRFSRWV